MIQFGTPFFTYIRYQAVLEPITEVEQYSILNDFLEVVAMQHRVDIDGSDTFPQLSSQIIMVAIEIEENFVFDHSGDATFADKLLLHTEVALFHVGEIEIDDQFYLIIHLVLEDALDIGIVKFCQLDDSMGYFPSLAVPVRD